MFIRTLESAHEILCARALWDSWPGSRDSEVDFFLYITSARSEVLRPYVVLALEDTTPEAMLIGRIEQRSVPIRFGYFDLSSPRIRTLTFVDGCLRGKTDDGTVNLLVGHALHSLRVGDIDVAVFEHVRLDSALYRSVNSLTGRLERGIPRQQMTRRSLRLPNSSEELYKVLSPGHRQNYRRKGRKLLKDFSGDVQVKSYETVSELDVAFSDVETIGRNTYQRTLGVSLRDNPEMRGAAELFASKGWLRLFILYVQGKPIAYWKATAYAGTLWGEYVGYDPEYGPYSPGMYLSLKVLSDICDGTRDTDITNVDFGSGDAEYKLLLSNQSCVEEDIWLYGRTVPAVGIKAYSAPILVADRFAKGILQKSRLLQKAKRLWRDRHAARARAKATDP